MEAACGKRLRSSSPRCDDDDWVMLCYVMLCYSLIIILYIIHVISYYTAICYITDATPQEQFLDHIEDDDARAIVRRCLVPADRIQMKAALGKGNRLQ